MYVFGPLGWSHDGSRNTIMANAVTLFKRLSHFLTHNLWRVRLDKLGKKQSFFIRQLHRRKIVITKLFNIFMKLLA